MADNYDTHADRRQLRWLTDCFDSANTYQCLPSQQDLGCESPPPRPVRCRPTSPFNLRLEDTWSSEDLVRTSGGFRVLLDRSSAGAERAPLRVLNSSSVTRSLSTRASFRSSPPPRAVHKLTKIRRRSQLRSRIIPNLLKRRPPQQILGRIRRTSSLLSQLSDGRHSFLVSSQWFAFRSSMALLLPRLFRRGKRANLIYPSWGNNPIGSVDPLLDVLSSDEDLEALSYLSSLPGVSGPLNPEEICPFLSGSSRSPTSLFLDRSGSAAMLTMRQQSHTSSLDRVESIHPFLNRRIRDPLSMFLDPTTPPPFFTKHPPNPLGLFLESPPTPPSLTGICPRPGSLVISGRKPSPIPFTVRPSAIVPSLGCITQLGTPAMEYIPIPADVFEQLISTFAPTMANRKIAFVRASSRRVLDYSSFDEQSSQSEESKSDLQCGALERPSISPAQTVKAGLCLFQARRSCESLVVKDNGRSFNCNNSDSLSGRVQTCIRYSARQFSLFQCHLALNTGISENPWKALCRLKSLVDCGPVPTETSRPKSQVPDLGLESVKGRLSYLSSLEIRVPASPKSLCSSLSASFGLATITEEPNDETIADQVSAASTSSHSPTPRPPPPPTPAWVPWRPGATLQERGEHVVVKTSTSYSRNYTPWRPGLESTEKRGVAKGGIQVTSHLDYTPRRPNSVAADFDNRSVSDFLSGLRSEYRLTEEKNDPTYAEDWVRTPSLTRLGRRSVRDFLSVCHSQHQELLDSVNDAIESSSSLRRCPSPSTDPISPGLEDSSLKPVPLFSGTSRWL